jgi:succinyl-diaminopimelate desuccinylase
LEMAARLGFRVKNVDNHAGYAEMGDGGELVGILAHLDVVPEGDAAAWDFPPYDASISDGMLYGRGAIDDKGPAVASLFAMRALRDSGIPLRHRFRLILGLDEESGSRCIKRYNEIEEIPAFSFSPDAIFPVVNAEKGILRVNITKTVRGTDGMADASIARLSGGERFNVVPDSAEASIICSREAADAIRNAARRECEITGAPNGLLIRTRGATAHAMEPEKGRNAAAEMVNLLRDLPLAPEDLELLGTLSRLACRGYDGHGLGVASSDDVSGPLTCNLGILKIAAGEPGEKKASAGLDIRYPVTADGEDILARARNAAEREGAELCVHTHKSPLFMPESSRVVRTLSDAYEAVTGNRLPPVSMGGGTYCRFMPNSVSFGPVFPGQPELAHQPNERVALEDMRRSTHIFAEALIRFNKC